jgi:hypothetical protein
LHIPEAYATRITTAIIVALGIDPTCEVRITGEERDGTVSETEYFDCLYTLPFDPAYQLYTLEGVDGRLPSTTDLGILGAFYVPLVPDNPEEQMHSRTRLDFSSPSHGRAYDWLSNGVAPTAFSGPRLKHGGSFRARLRDFKKNVSKRFKILNKHLVYLVKNRQRKNVARNIRIQIHPHRIVPFADEVDQVRLPT